MSTWGGQVRKLRGGSWVAGGCLRLQEECPPVRQGVEVTTSPRRERGAGAPESPENEIAVAQEGRVEEEGEAEVEVGVGLTPEEME